MENELREISERYELAANQLRLMQVEREMEQEKAEQLNREYRQLHDEYTKLQTEYNEWIELIEQDQT